VKRLEARLSSLANRLLSTLREWRLEIRDSRGADSGLSKALNILRQEWQRPQWWSLEGLAGSKAFSCGFEPQAEFAAFSQVAGLDKFI
jgi:hypothetical protein